tara:strand:+ start:544 stop:810 length:267 start_codon:yes stop_codon:yes gene_type:complete
MTKYICTAKIKYTRQEVELHINALKIALQVPADWRGTKEKGRLSRAPYKALLKDMERIKNEMLYKEEDALINGYKHKEEVESTVVQDA